MAGSSADATAENAATLRVELQETMTVILGDGGVGRDDGSSGGLKDIDEAIRALKRLKNFFLKKREPHPHAPSSSSPSRKVQVPNEFKCPLSYAIMSEPVLIASGQTYEKRYITQWLSYNQTCPKTKEVLPYRMLTRNQLLDDFITFWCQANKCDRPNPSGRTAIGLMSDDIDSLLHRVSSPSLVEDPTEAANELSRQIQKYENVRAFFYAGMPDSITKLLSPVSELGNELGSNPELHEDIITALVYILGYAEDKIAVSQVPLVIPLLTMSLKQGTGTTRNSAAVALVTLSRVNSDKINLGNSETLKALIDAFKDGTYSAGVAIFTLCLRSESTTAKAVSEGLIPVLVNNIRARSHVEMTLKGLSIIFSYNGVFEQMEDLGFVDDLLSVLRNTVRPEIAENALEIVYGMCCAYSGHRNRESTRRKVVEEEEMKYATFSSHADQGSGTVKTLSEAILKWLKG